MPAHSYEAHMTVSVQTPVNSYTSAGTSTFVYGFQALSSSHIAVTKNGVTMTLGTDYSVTGVGNANGGTITGLSTIAGDLIVIYRSVPLQRLTDYQGNGDLLASTLNPDFDLIWQALQGVNEKTARALTVPIGSSASGTLPTPVANSFLGWDSLGLSIQNYAGLASAAVSTFMATVVATVSAAAARLLLGVAPRATRIDVASVAGTVDLTANAPDTDDIRITGALAITAFTVAAGRVIRVTANGAFTLNNNANIITQVGSNIVAAAGDTFMLRATAANTVEVLNYVRASGNIQVSVLTSGSGTYTTPVGAKWLNVKMVGGGAGGWGSGSASAGTGGAGGNTTFGANTAGGGLNAGGNNTQGGAGGTPTLSVGVGIALFGGSGGGSAYSASSGAFQNGGSGGCSAFGGGAGMAAASNPGAAGLVNTGGGGAGGGASGNANVNTGPGGGAGAYIDCIISSPASTYAYSIGAGGAGGTAGTSGNAGGAGGSGVIMVTAYF